jgi:hypothetical protein
MRTFASVAELLGDGDNTEANDGSFENVLVQTGPDITGCGPGQVIVAVKAACINYPDLLQTVVRAASAGLRTRRCPCRSLRVCAPRPMSVQVWQALGGSTTHCSA